MHLEHCFHLYAYLAKHLQQSRGRWSGGRICPGLFRHVYTGVKANTKMCSDAKDMSKLLSASLPRPLPQKYGKQRSGMDYPKCSCYAECPLWIWHTCAKQTCKNSVISYRRHKTGTLADHRDSSRCHEPYQTVSKYRFHLPLPASHSSGKRKRRRICRIPTCLAELTHDLKQLAVYCGIKLNVSSYTSRHTWATLANTATFRNN